MSTTACRVSTAVYMDAETLDALNRRGFAALKDYGRQALPGLHRGLSDHPLNAVRQGQRDCRQSFTISRATCCVARTGRPSLPGWSTTAAKRSRP
jgi:hypothetical protein